MPLVERDRPLEVADDDGRVVQEHALAAFASSCPPAEDSNNAGVDAPGASREVVSSHPASVPLAGRCVDHATTPDSDASEAACLHSHPGALLPEHKPESHPELAGTPQRAERAAGSGRSWLAPPGTEP